MSNDEVVEVGRVTSVSVDNGDVFVSVRTTPSFEHTYIEWAQPSRRITTVPKIGEAVEVRESQSRGVVAQYPVSGPDHTIPSNLTAGDVCISLTNQMALTITEADDGTVNFELTTDGDVSINGSTITIGDNSLAEALSKASHTHDVTLSDGTTATTGSPNEAGTNTKVE